MNFESLSYRTEGVSENLHNRRHEIVSHVLTDLFSSREELDQELESFED